MAIDPQIEAMLSMVEAKHELGDRFCDIRRIGSDGGQGYFSFLFNALDKVSNERVALKFYRPDRRSDGYRWASYQREAEILGDLRPCKDFIKRIAPIQEFTEVATTTSGFSVPIPFAYYALELAENDVASHLAATNLSLAEKLKVFHAMCRGAQRLHSQGVAHRDFKASNFLRMPDGTVKLSDLGTARRLTPFQPPLGAIYMGPVGDRRYVAPELQIALHDQYPEMSFSGDIFALGATLFELITGTTLGPLVYTKSLLDGLDRCISHPSGFDRRVKFEGMISQLANGHPLPKMSSLAADIPHSVRNIVQGLFQNMCALDYRKRLVDFSQIFLRTQRCVFVLEHAVKYDEWSKERRRRRDLRMAKVTGRTTTP